MKRRRHDLSSVFLTFDVPDAPCKNYAESLTIWRRMFLIGCIQHVVITLCGPVVFLYGLIPVTLAAWSISFTSAACIILVEWMIVLDGTTGGDTSFSIIQVEWMVSSVYQLRSAWTSFSLSQQQCV